jgi:hypothetical protein
MSPESKIDATEQPTNRPVIVTLVGGHRVTCPSLEDAELVRGADRRRYEGQNGRKLPRQTLAALERAGLHRGNSQLYRSALHNLEDQPEQGSQLD